MLFLLLRKFEGVETLSGDSALFSEQEMGSKLFSTFSAIFSAGVLQSCSAAALLLFAALVLLPPLLPSRWALMASASL